MTPDLTPHRAYQSALCSSHLLSILKLGETTQGSGMPRALSLITSNSIKPRYRAQGGPTVPQDCKRGANRTVISCSSPKTLISQTGKGHRSHRKATAAIGSPAGVPRGTHKHHSPVGARLETNGHRQQPAEQKRLITLLKSCEEEAGSLGKMSWKIFPRFLSLAAIM